MGADFSNADLSEANLKDAQFMVDGIQGGLDGLKPVDIKGELLTQGRKCYQFPGTSIMPWCSKTL